MNDNRDATVFEKHSVISKLASSTWERIRKSGGFKILRLEEPTVFMTDYFWRQA